MLEFFAYIAVLGIIIYGLTVILPKFHAYRDKTRRQDLIVEKYENLRKLRRELMYHIDWAYERGERNEAVKLEPEIERIDKQLAELKSEYDQTEAGEKEKVS